LVENTRAAQTITKAFVVKADMQFAVDPGNGQGATDVQSEKMD
jgi:hypothetical protein